MGRNPTARGKRGTKRSLLAGADGGPLSVVVAGADVHDTKLLRATLEAVVVKRPTPTSERPQHRCLDKGYDIDEVRELVAHYGYPAHVRSRGAERGARHTLPGYRAQR